MTASGAPAAAFGRPFDWADVDPATASTKAKLAPSTTSFFIGLILSILSGNPIGQAYPLVLSVCQSMLSHLRRLHGGSLPPTDREREENIPGRAAKIGVAGVHVDHPAHHDGPRPIERTPGGLDAIHGREL